MNLDLNINLPHERRFDTISIMAYYNYTLHYFTTTLTPEVTSYISLFILVLLSYIRFHKRTSTGEFLVVLQTYHIVFVV